MENKSRKRLLSGIILIVILTIIDRLTKIWAAKTLSQGFDIVLIPRVLELHYIENTGAAFSILTGKIIFFLIITVIMCVFIVAVMLKTPAESRFDPFFYCLVFLLSGALGNFYDRLFYNYVVDFIYFVLINFPVFNVADIYVTLSMACLVVLILFYYKDEDLSRIFKRRES
ncbi:MAG: signal peptidase II [Lachnospiraceae bacterium]|nr:signal peptidase II [Lachnospiraceae bacterium]